MKNPTFHFERELIAQGCSAIVGVDEVGCGALAGPVVAAAVILPLNSRLSLVRDSKLLSSGQRERLFDIIRKKANDNAVGRASVEEIKEIGLRQATYLAMRRAVEAISEVDHVLVDAWKIPGIPFPQTNIIHGDRLVKSIAAASIIAKVTRDREMIASAKEYPEYGFEKHMGYATRAHRDAIKRHGACPIHRTGWKIFQPRLISE